MANDRPTILPSECVWFLEAWSHATGWVAVHSSSGLLAHARTPDRVSSEDTAMIWQFVRACIHHLCHTTTSTKANNRWPSVVSEHVTRSVDLHTMNGISLSFLLRRDQYAALGFGCLGRRATWPNPAALDRFLGRLNAIARAANVPHVLRVHPLDAHPSAHARLQERLLYAQIPLLGAHNTRLLVNWKARD